MKFIYRFVSSKEVENFTGRVKIYAVVENPGMWKKEVLLKETTTSAPQLSTNFPLNLEELEEVISEIEDEIGISTSTHYITIEPRVRILARVGSVKINDSFIHPLQLKLTSNTLECQRELTIIESKSSQGVDYEHHGEYDYTVRLEENSLFEGRTMKPPPSPPPLVKETSPTTTVTVGSDSVLFTKIIDHIEMTYSYHLRCDQPLQSVREEIEITAMVENPKLWSKSYVLVPSTTGAGEFKFTFPLDIAELTEEASAIGSDLGAITYNYPLTITATVHTAAQSEFGPIDDTFTQTLTTTLGGSTLDFSELAKSESDSIESTIIVTNDWVDKSRPWFLVAMVLVMAAGGYVMGLVFRQRPLKLAKPSPTEQEAQQAIKKHKDIIADVPELAGRRAWEIVVPLSTFDDLVKVADGLGKTVLHHAGTDKHTYYVIDGMSRYEYVSHRQLQDVSPEFTPDESKD